MGQQISRVDERMDTQREHALTMPEAVNYVCRDWLPQRGYQRAATPCLEWYDERFHFGLEDSEMDIHTPIVPA